MIRIIAGGKPPKNWQKEGVEEYTTRLRTPFNTEWEFLPEEKLLSKLANWPFSSSDYVIILDERGKNLSSPEFSEAIQSAWNNSKNITIIIGGAFGFPKEIREKANLLLSYGKEVFPHEIARIVLAEQIYRASEISHGSNYHHE